MLVVECLIRCEWLAALEYTWFMWAKDGTEAKRVAEDCGEVHAAEISVVRESWKRPVVLDLGVNKSG